jgi:ADP-ribosylglycohydrolase
MMNRHYPKDVLLGMAVGDALGVPVEFKSRTYLADNPIKTMLEYGTHHQPAGTWSDDSSLAFCLAESLCGDFDLMDIARRFVNWYHYNYWTPYGKVFDIGIATQKAIARLENGVDPAVSGGNSESDNGNGSLMRILPLVFHLKDLPLEERVDCVTTVSSITHGHFRACYACLIYTEIALQLLQGKSKEKEMAYQETKTLFSKNEVIKSYFYENGFHWKDNKLFERILAKDIASFSKDEIDSQGYVIYTLEAALWSWLHSDNYADTVLLATNLGEGTDTTACVAGGLAGLMYGREQIPKDWLAVLARRKDIEDLADRLQQRYY